MFNTDIIKISNKIEIKIYKKILKLYVVNFLNIGYEYKMVFKKLVKIIKLSVLIEIFGNLKKFMILFKNFFIFNTI